jgi:uncharacterized membrane protein YfcA
MNDLIWVALAGFAASLVDGALGMGFGPTSSSILLGTGLSPASVSTTVNLAKVVTGIVAALSHWRFRNVSRRLVLQLALPGCIGAILGVTVLSKVDGDTLRPALAVLLFVMGLRILWRFRKPMPSGNGGAGVEDAPLRQLPSDDRGVLVAGAAGGVTNGMIGAWGPVVTPYLMHRRVAPRYAVGSVNTAEVAVAAMSVASLLTALGSGELDLSVVLAMLAGGVVAAPVAAWFVRHVPARPMGVAVAAMLLLTNARELVTWSQLGDLRWLVYSAVSIAVALTALLPRLRGAHSGLTR